MEQTENIEFPPWEKVVPFDHDLERGWKAHALNLRYLVELTRIMPKTVGKNIELWSPTESNELSPMVAKGRTQLDNPFTYVLMPVRV